MSSCSNLRYSSCACLEGLGKTEKFSARWAGFPIGTETWHCPREKRQTSSLQLWQSQNAFVQDIHWLPGCESRTHCLDCGRSISGCSLEIYFNLRQITANVRKIYLRKMRRLWKLNRICEKGSQIGNVTRRYTGEITLTHWGRGHLNCLNARSRGF